MLRGMNKRNIQPDEKLLAVLEESRARARSVILKQVGNRGKLQHYKNLCSTKFHKYVWFCNMTRRNMSWAGKYMVVEFLN